MLLELPEYLAPSLNEIKRMHFHADTRANKRAVNHVFDALQRADVLGILMVGSVTVIYTRVRRSGPPLDDDNLAGSFKVLGDALQKLGVVANDRDITLEARQHPRDGKAGFWGTRLELVPEKV